MNDREVSDYAIVVDNNLSMLVIAQDVCIQLDDHSPRVKSS